MKENKGITLVALIITIIVLLILAVVTISAVNEGSLFAHANNAATSYSKAQEEENTIIANYLGKFNRTNNELNGIYYDKLYKWNGITLWKGVQVDTMLTLKINKNNDMHCDFYADTNFNEGEDVHQIGDMNEEYMVTEPGGNTEFIIESIVYNTEYTAYNALGIPVTIWFNNDGDLYETYTIPGEYININEETRIIDIGNGTVTGTYSIDGKTINITGETFVIE